MGSIKIKRRLMRLRRLINILMILELIFLILVSIPTFIKLDAYTVTALLLIAVAIFVCIVICIGFINIAIKDVYRAIK